MSNIWDDLDKAASEDNRVGNHDFLVDSVTDGEWEPGRAYRELDGRLTTADNFNIKQRFNVTPDEEVVAAGMSSWDQKTKRSVNLSHQNDIVLAKEYGCELNDIKQGDTFRVKTDHQKGKDGKQYVRIVNFLPKTASLSSNGNASDVPF